MKMSDGHGSAAHEHFMPAWNVYACFSR